MLAFTDCSVKNGLSTNSYILMNWKGRVIKKVSFVGLEDRSFQSEIDSIIKLLNYCSSKRITDVKIITDCKNIVQLVYDENNANKDIEYLKHLLNITKSKIRWKPRKYNKADKLCRDHMKVIMNRNNSR